MANTTMSIEAALDEERKSVLALLEGAPQSPRAQWGLSSSAGSGGRNSSPFATPRSPVRSMLDISEEPAPQTTRGAQTLPTQAHHKNGDHVNHNSLHPRSMSDATGRLAEFGHGAGPERSTKGDPTASYQFSGYIPTGGLAAPKRNTLGGRLAGPGAMAEVVR